MSYTHGVIGDDDNHFQPTLTLTNYLVKLQVENNTPQIQNTASVLV